jgi:hypothetical protein
MPADWNHSEHLVVPFERTFLLYRVCGLLRVEAQGLCLEFQTLENLLGVMRSRVRQVQIRWCDLSSFTLVLHRLRGAEIQIQTRHLKALKGLPGSLQGRYHCFVRRRDRALAEELVLQVELALSAERLRQLNTPAASPAEGPLPQLLLRAAARRLRGLLDD